MNPAEARLADAQRKFSVCFAQFLNDQDAEAFWPAVAEFRDEVKIAAEGGAEHWTIWQMVAQWITEPEDRIYCYSRALAAMEIDPQYFGNSASQHQVAVRSFFRADFLAKIAEIHVQQGRRELARKFYEQALPLARASSDYQGDAVVAGSGLSSLEGRISGGLLLLDSNEDNPE